MMPFEAFKRQRLKPGAEPLVTIQKKGVLSLNRAAYVALDNPEAVELLYDRETRLIGLRKIDSSVDHAYAIRSFGKGGTWLVSGTAFTNFYDIDTSVPTRRTGRIEDGILIIDLNDPGTPALSNRERRKADLEAEPHSYQVS
jgi:hypothetical protein